MFQDFNNDGVRDEFESPYGEGWTVRLLIGDQVFTTTTAADGSYSFSLPLDATADYTLEVAAPGSETPGWSFLGTIDPGSTLSVDLPIPQE